jgi:hypothetical protein
MNQPRQEQGTRQRVELFDAQTGFGGAEKGNPDVVSPDELVAEMARLDIGRGLVRIAPDDLVADVQDANDELEQACRAHPEWVPCPILVPNGGGDLPSEEDQIGRALAAGAGAVSLRPKLDYWDLADWCCGTLLAALEASRLPAYCLGDRFSFEEIAGLARRYSDLPVIVAGIQYRSHRILIPLLEAFPNVYLSLGSNYTVHRGTETLVERLGPDRFLFGTGFPTVEPMAAVSMLTYADISTEAKEAIGAGNLDRLVRGVRR